MTTTLWHRRLAAGLTAAAVAALTTTALAGPAGAAPTARSVGAETVSVAAPFAPFASTTPGATPPATPEATPPATPEATPTPTPTTTATPAPAPGKNDCSADFFGSDARLGPATLPTHGRVGYELAGYHRTGSLSLADFLTEYYEPTLYGGTGGWIYPPQNGYELRSNGTPIEYHKTLRVGRKIDRYGSEYGAFLSPAGLPFLDRSIPPSNLDSSPPATCNYHQYQVLKAFGVDAGRIAAWFAQPGGGWQYQLDPAQLSGSPTSLNVLWLVNNGYLKRLS